MFQKYDFPVSKLITWYDRWIGKKYRTMQEDLPISYLLSSRCTHCMQDTTLKQLDIRRVFWVWTERALFFSPGQQKVVRRKNGSLPLNTTDWICTHLWQMSNYEQKLSYSPGSMQSPFTSFTEKCRVWSLYIIILSIPLGQIFVVVLFFNCILVSGLISHHFNWIHIKHFVLITSVFCFFF